MLLNLMMADPETEKVKSELAKHTEEVKKLACNIFHHSLMNIESNLQQKNELNQLIYQFDEKYVIYS